MIMASILGAGLGTYRFKQRPGINQDIIIIIFYYILLLYSPQFEYNVHYS